MTESEYIAATNLANLRVVFDTLSRVLPATDDGQIKWYGISQDGKDVLMSRISIAIERLEKVVKIK